MITSSLNRIIKHGSDVEIEQFIPPVQMDRLPARQERGGEEFSGRGGSASGEEDAAGEAADLRGDAEKEADQMLLKAQQMVGDLLRDARDQAESIKRNAVSEGYREGYEQGLMEGREKAGDAQEEFQRQQKEEFRREMTHMLELAEQAREEYLRSYLDELKNCAVAIAEKVIHVSLNSSGEIIKRMLVAETEKMKKRAWVKIYMEKTDYDMMVEADPDVVGELAKLSDNIKFVVMDKENSGNCIIEMPDEIVDISVDTQMENIREILENVRF